MSDVNEIAPGCRFWALLGAMAVAIIVASWALNWTGPLLGDGLGLIGSLLLIYGTVASLGTRSALSRLASVQRDGRKSETAIKVTETLERLGAKDTRRDLGREVRAVAAGATLLAAGFAVDAIGILQLAN